MPAPPRPLADEIAAALAWWREAGVGNALRDEPAPWLSPSRPVAEEAARERRALRAALDASPPPTPTGPAFPGEAALPRDLAAFIAWWLGDPALDDGRVAGRVAPRGPAGARLMVVVPGPEADDGERLLSGPQGRLLAAMLAAMRVDAEEVYVASALPRHTPVPDWPALAVAGLGRVLARHVALVGPARLVCLGGTIPSLLGHDPPKSSAEPREFAHGGVRTPMLAARSLDALLDKPGWKAAVWRTWLEWTR